MSDSSSDESSIDESNICDDDELDDLEPMTRDYVVFVENLDAITNFGSAVSPARNGHMKNAVELKRLMIICVISV